MGGIINHHHDHDHIMITIVIIIIIMIIIIIIIVSIIIIIIIIISIIIMGPTLGDASTSITRDLLRCGEKSRNTRNSNVTSLALDLRPTLASQASFLP